MSMNPEKPRNPFGWRRWLAVIVVVAFMVEAVLWVRSSRKTVMFTVVDATSRERLTNARARLMPWTTLPVEKLGISSWRSRDLSGVGGKFEVDGILRHAAPLFILFEESNHFHGVFQITCDGSFRVHYDGPGGEPDLLVPRTNKITVALTPGTNIEARSIKGGEVIA